MDLAERLLEAHVAHQVAELRGPGFPALVEAEIDHALARAAEITLDDVVDRVQVKAVAAKYVASFTLPGAIPELVGDLAARLRVHPANEATVAEVLPRRHVEALVGKVAELRAVREWLAAQIAASPAVQAGVADYLRSMATGAIETNRRIASRLPGVGTAWSMGEKLANVSGATREADQRSREIAEKAAVSLLQRWRDSMLDSVTDESVLTGLMEVWDGVSDRPMSAVVESLGEDDLIDLVVVAYEAWLELRVGDYLPSLIDTGVDYFFDTYGAFSLADLLAEFGLGRDDLVEEALRFAPPAIEALAERGILDDLVRRRLASFYSSPAAQAILSSVTD